MTTQELDFYISRYILSRNPLHRNIEGAPFNIGEPVRILDNPSNDETFNFIFAKRIGHVEFFEYECGCGQTYPEDPMIGVIFTDGKVGEFWAEELVRLPT